MPPRYADAAIFAPFFSMLSDADIYRHRHAPPQIILHTLPLRLPFHALMPAAMKLLIDAFAISFDYLILMLYAAYAAIFLYAITLLRRLHCRFIDAMFLLLLPLPSPFSPLRLRAFDSYAAAIAYDATLLTRHCLRFADDCAAAIA